MKKSRPPKPTEKQGSEDMHNPHTHLELVPSETTRAVAKPKPVKFRDFNRFVADVDRLLEFYGDLDEMASGDIEDNAEWCAELVAKCKAGLERYDRRDDHEDPEDDESPLTQEYIAKRISVMVASFPNANPSSPEGYLQMLVEHVAASDGLTAAALESGCREIVETQKFAPAISEVVAAIRKQIDEWYMRYVAIWQTEERRLDAMEAAIKREDEERKQKYFRAVLEAKNAVECAMRATQKLAQDIEKAKAALAKTIEAQTRELEDLQQSMQQTFARVQNDANENIAKLVEQHAEAEKREIECKRKLDALTATEEEAHAAMKQDCS